MVQGATYNYKTTSSLGGSSYTKTITAVRPDGFTVTEQFPNSTNLTKEWGCTSDGPVSLAPIGGDSATVASN